MKTPELARKKAIAEYLANGNMTRAAKVGGVNRSTLHRWLQKQAPDVEDAKAAIRDEVHDKIVELLKTSLGKLGAALEKDRLSAPQLAIISGILADKAHRLAPPKAPGEEEGVEVTVKVKRGGARVSTGVVDASGMVAVQVEPT